MQLLIPHDFMKVMSTQSSPNTMNAITGHSFAALLQKIAEEKDAYITVILDCCFRGSGTRYTHGEDTGLGSVRGFQLDRPLPGDLDIDISRGLLRSELNSDAHADSKQISRVRAPSHVLLTACRGSEVAVEERGRGRFTRALLEVLRSIETTNVTYKEVIMRLPDLPGQNPQCEGINMDSKLFNGGTPNSHRPTYHIRKQDGAYTMDAGVMHGITPGNRFEVYESITHTGHGKNMPLGELVAGTIALSTTQMVVPSNGSAFDIKSPPAFAQLAVRAEEKATSPLRVSADMKGELGHVFDSHAFQIYRDGHPGDLQIVGEKGVSDVDIIIENGQAVFRITHSLTNGFGLTRIIDIEVDDKTIYGIRITNLTEEALYASPFYFDSSDLSITSYYQPPIFGRLQADRNLALLPAKGSLTVGYGSGGVAPWGCFLRDGQELDVGYFKLFLSTKPVDLSSIPQASPFPGSRAREAAQHRSPPKDKLDTKYSDTIMIAVVQHAPGRLYNALSSLAAEDPRESGPANSVFQGGASAQSSAPHQRGKHRGRSGKYAQKAVSAFKRYF
ncbi:hypothetical protein OF83DRAFT_1145252 [Amylostereum chailletii]|nr:hypothetical protein OF83DRAFT_1145252 [Amylostereum chailletii]